jgi:alpha-glucosidase/oligosaccharide 4-alpha-D-glucosyltransferase
MNTIYLFFITLFLLITGPFYGQDGQREFISYRAEGNILEVEVSDGLYRLLPYTTKIMECSFIPAGETYDPQSHAVVLTPESLEAQVSDLGHALTWSASGLTVRIDKSPFRITYFYKDKLISERRGFIASDSTRQIEFKLEKDEALYGGGARVLGMDRRGNLLKLYNRAHYGYETHSELMNYTMPLVLSSKMYAIHFDNAPIGYLDLDSEGNNTLRYESISGRMTYQVIAGDDWADVMDQYTQLTGRQPMPPRWAFGNFSSRFGYHSEQEVRETVERFFKDSIPLDAVVIDIYWFGADIKGHMGNLEFLRDSFPTPEKMMADFKARGIKTILVTEPFILTTSKRWEEAVEKDILATDSTGKPYTYDFYFGHTGIIDIYKPEARQWFWEVYKEFTEMGVDGWWGDLGEPEVHPSDLIHATGTADEVHNIYGHDWAGLIHEGYQMDFPDERPFILMRAGYSGSQRYGMIPWSGDVMRSWGGLKPQVEIALQMGMQGLAYMHSDLGGFAEGKVFDPQLYARWLQYGVFQPIFRPHAQEHIPAEPVFHDPATKALARQAILLRYSMLPYNYTLAFENNQTGIPLMRPVFFEEPENAKTWTMDEVYLWGDQFLVAPVKDSLATHKKVYFPAGSSWIDFNTGTVYEGGKKQKVKLADEHIPVFVRGGAFIPMVEPVLSTETYSTRSLDVHYYFDPEIGQSKYRMYDDDGSTLGAYEAGQYEYITMEAVTSGEKLDFTLASLPGSNYTAFDRTIKMVVHGLERSPQLLEVDGRKADFTWDEQSRVLDINIRLKASGNTNIRVVK